VVNENREELAAFPVSQEDILSGKLLNEFPGMKKIIRAAEEACHNADTRTTALLSYSLLVFLTGKRPSCSPFVNPTGDKKVTSY